MKRKSRSAATTHAIKGTWTSHGTVKLTRAIRAGERLVVDAKGPAIVRVRLFSDADGRHLVYDSAAPRARKRKPKT